MIDSSFTEIFAAEGYKYICGVDEAGRGPLAGPIVAAACILPLGLKIEGLNDSKKLTPKRRDELFDIICEKAVAYSIASASNEEIDQLNILNASMIAMIRAIDTLPVKADLALVDGNIARGFKIKAVPIIKGDQICPSIAAASILAKVTRDRICLEYDALYPEYGFASHKGYPTKQHKENIIKYGILPIHRKTFLKFLDKEPTSLPVNRK
ncbi:MAG: ribonuclease HII [Clostridiales bacterium]|nr:ribonuclease HII [Clostridiales bacterium]